MRFRLSKMESHVARKLTAALIVAALAGVVGLPASGDDLVEDVHGDAEVEGSLAPGDVHRYRMTLVAGTEIRLDLGAEPEEDSAKDLPDLVLIDPQGTVFAPDESEPRRIRETVTVTGIHVAEIRASGFEGEYELEIRAEPPESVESQVEVSGEPVSVKLDAPVGASVRITVRRLSGAPPAVASIHDGTGRELGFEVRRARKNKVRLIKGDTGVWLRPNEVKEIRPGDTVWVPAKPERDWWAFFKDAMWVSAQIATVAIVINQIMTQ